MNEKCMFSFVGKVKFTFYGRNVLPLANFNFFKHVVLKNKVVIMINI